VFKRVLKIAAVSVVTFVVVAVVVVKLMPYRASDQDQRFYFPSTQMEPVTELRHETVWFDAADGVRISGLMLRPEGMPKATLLMLHGSGGNATRYVAIAKPVVKAGYQVVILDWRGYGLTPGVPTHANVLEDSQAALDQLQKRAEVIGRPVLLWGLSMGGQAAIVLAERNQKGLAGLVTEGAVSSFREVASDASPSFMSPFLWVVVKGPYEARAAMAGIDHLPKLIIQSHDDKDVPRQRGLALFKAAQAPKTLWEVPGEHLGAMAADSAGYVSRIDNLLASRHP
jgi:alpha-beta hydrolase superfamily lysophospholipase